MNRRREEDKQRAKEVAEAEIEKLKAEGKVGPKKFVTKSVSERTKRQQNSARSSKKSPRDRLTSPREDNSRLSEQLEHSKHIPELHVSLWV